MAEISLRAVGKSYPQRNAPPFVVFEGIDLTVASGSFVALVGPSGCGKSTLLNLIAGFDRPNAGSVWASGEPVSGPSPDRVVVFQEGGLLPWLTVEDNVAFGLKQRGVGRRERLGRARDQLQAVHLGRFAHRFPHELSGGMKQRAAIARALVLDPPILLMDEPFSALDEQTRSILQGELIDLWGRSKPTVVFVTHNIREALLLADRVVVLGAHPGRILRDLAVTVERPRDLLSSDLTAWEKIIMGDLAFELDKVAQLEGSIGYPGTAVDFSPPPGHRLGSGL